jgi:hypothetical protein
MTINVPQVAQERNNKTSNTTRPTGKRRNRFKSSIEDIDEDVYAELWIEDDRNAETIARTLGFKSKTPVENSFERLEALAMVELVPRPNGGRGNCRYRKVKLTGKDRIEEIDLFNAPHYENWNQKTRMQLIERYMRIGWNVVPLKKDLTPIMDRDDWATLATQDKLTMFRDQVFGVGMWTKKFMIVDGGCGVDTLIAKTPDGFNAYFLLTPMPLETRFVVLPPTQGYAWANLVQPRHLYHFPELLFCDQREFLRRIASTDSVFKKYVLPDYLVGSARHDHLFRHGRSLRAYGASPEEIINELLRVNDEVCDPPIDGLKLEAIIQRVCKLENDPSFAARVQKKRKKC